MIYIVTILIAILLVGLYVFVGPRMWRKKVSAQKSAEIRRMWTSVDALTDAHRQVMESAALLDRTLKELHFEGTLGDKWKRASLYSNDTERVWKAIKLRNVLAHEIGSTIGTDEAKQTKDAFKRASELFLR